MKHDASHNIFPTKQQAANAFTLLAATNVNNNYEIIKRITKFYLVADTALSFKTTSIILVILRKNIIFAHSDAGSTASGVSFYRSYKIIFVGGKSNATEVVF